MLRPQKKITKKEIQQDALWTAYDKGTSFYEEHKKQVQYGAVALVLLVAAIFVYINNRRHNNENAAVELGKVFSIYDAGANDLKQYQIAINGIPERNIHGLKWIVDNCGGTENGEVARFYLANAYYMTGQVDAALEEYDDFGGSDRMLQASAYAGIGACYESKKQYDKAAGYFEKAAGRVSDGAETPNYLNSAARCYGIAGDKEKAVALLKRLKKEFPASSFARDADRYIGEFSI